MKLRIDRFGNELGDPARKKGFVESETAGSSQLLVVTSVSRWRGSLVLDWIGAIGEWYGIVGSSGRRLEKGNG